MITLDLRDEEGKQCLKAQHEIEDGREREIVRAKITKGGTNWELIGG